MINFQQLQYDIQHERSKTRKEAWDNVGRKGFLKSRGSYVYAINGGNVVAGEAETIEYEGTKKQLLKMIEQYPGCEIQVSGGFDYAESPRAYYNDGDYEPWVGDWSVIAYKQGE